MIASYILIPVCQCKGNRIHHSSLALHHDRAVYALVYHDIHVDYIADYWQNTISWQHGL